MQATASSAKITVSPNKVFNLALTAEQIQLLLQVLSEAHFKGSKVMLAAEMIRAIQDPLLLEAHDPKAANNPVVEQ